MNRRRKNGINKIAIIAAAAAVVVLIIVIKMIGTPKAVGDKIESGTVAGNNTASVATVNNQSGSEGGQIAEANTGGENPTETTTATEDPNAEKTNPKNYAEAVETEKNAKKRVYLTFDDGPSVNTDKVLDILKKYNVKATFFNIKRNDPVELAAQKRAYEEGHSMAVHSDTHDYYTIYKSLNNYKKDVLSEQNFLSDQLGGVKVKYYRFPGGSSNAFFNKFGLDRKKCFKWLHDEGIEYFDWNSDNGDATGRVYAPSQLVKNVMATTGNYDIMVLMHDTKAKESTLKSLPSLIESLKDKGYTFCQITENTETKNYQHRKL